MESSNVAGVLLGILGGAAGGYFLCRAGVSFERRKEGHRAAAKYRRSSGSCEPSLKRAQRCVRKHGGDKEARACVTLWRKYDRCTGV